MASAGNLKIHIGCGKRHIPGWVHVDQVAFPHVDHVQDIRDLSNFADGTAEIIYACQVVEYFDREEVPTVLREWRRVLAPSGLLRLSVPNFAVISRLYEAGFALEWFLGTLYGRISDGNGGYVYHRTTYDEASLRHVLEASGFADARLWRWQDVEHGNVDDFSQAYIPHMEKERGILLNLNMEAVRR
jgi:ubiquinone/menaquinone biosynthesis C-methylase UbiE